MLLLALWFVFNPDLSLGKATQSRHHCALPRPAGGDIFDFLHTPIVRHFSTDWSLGKTKKTLLTRPQSSPVVTDSLFSFQFTGQLCMRMRKPAHRTAPFNSTWQLFEQEPLANESGRKGETTTCKDDVKENFTGRTNGTWSFCYIHLRIHRTSSNLLCPNHIVNGWKWRGGGFNYMFWCDVKAPITSIGKVQAARSCAYVFHMRVVFQNHQLYP